MTVLRGWPGIEPAAWEPLSSRQVRLRDNPIHPPGRSHTRTKAIKSMTLQSVATSTKLERVIASLVRISITSFYRRLTTPPPRDSFMLFTRFCLVKYSLCLGMYSKLYHDNRTHYTIIQSTVWYDTQLANDSLTTLIVFRSRNYTDSFFSYLHLFSDIPSSDNAFSICAGFASDRIGRVYVNSTNVAGLIFFHKILTFHTII